MCIRDRVVTAWFGLVAPAGTPATVIDTLYAATRDVCLLYTSRCV